MLRRARPADDTIAGFARDVSAALGDDLLSLVLYGSAAGEDWVAGRSDVNTAIVVPRVTVDVLAALAPVIARWRPQGFALPAVVDREFLVRARDAFPMEFDDIGRQHRILVGTDPFSAITIDRAVLRREWEREARGKLLRLRAHFLAAHGTGGVERLMMESLTSFLVILRHLLRLRGEREVHGYAEVLAAGEAALGPLPAMRRVFEHRVGDAPLPADALHVEFGRYLDEVERIVTAVDGLDA